VIYVPVGATGSQAIGSNHNSYVLGHVGHGQFTDGSDGSWITKCDPLSAPIPIQMTSSAEGKTCG